MTNHNDRGFSVATVYTLLIVIALSVVSGRIATVISREGDTPFLSANDRSRWCTIAALVENGTYQIDPFLERRGIKQNRRPWATIDLVRHQGRDGQLHYYSSKPPLLPTLYAGVYWCVSRTVGMWLSDYPIYVGRIVLWLVNVPTLFVFLLCTILAIDRITQSVWAKCFLAASVCFGTMLLPFTIALNNHLPAAASAAVVLYVYVRSLDTTTGHGWWLLAGLAAGFTAANELPALSMTVFWAGLLLLVRRPALPAYCAGVLVVAAAFFATNWIAHQSLRPPYMHRGDGDLIATLPQTNPGVEEVRSALLKQALAAEQSDIQIGPSRVPQRSRVLVDGKRQFGLIQLDDGPAQLRHWDDWYDYPSSYWVDGKRRGVDIGQPSRLVYAAHMTFGHYGIFSLTPIWLLMPIGLLGLRASRSTELRLLLAAIALATVVCAVFYVLRPEIDRNYGGVSVCFRWMLWFAPLWLFAIAGPVEWLSGRSWGRCLTFVLLAASVTSVSISLDGPWQSPWLYRFWHYLGWIAP
ncbi:hypothetical protein Mal15_13880 [Stieleria maiorica]|uniref:Glycosyltransferase RgtA/B/C/D-like domain-containing protein n=1 Tax=Stieleria maiorica TaxID=2795974 RepID=A0A5B9M832_9BACT|nr:hypothetical protein [Stieleria maiorica]QEF97348.1 hypothetical protein Mal15_13880 [Stieleria maiorica]